MATRKLGRGLDSLIQRTEEIEPQGGEVLHIDPHQILLNRSQPRRRFDEDALEELKSSIRQEGVIQPLLVRAHEQGGFELIAGERRLRAALALELESVPVITRDLESSRLLELALIENIQREDLHPIELAKAYKELKDRHQWTQSKLAERLGKNRSTVANTLRVLELPHAIQESLAAGKISAGHAKALLSIESEEQQLEVHKELLAGGISVRALEERLQLRTGPGEGATPDNGTAAGGRGRSSRPSRRVKPPHIVEQEEILSRGLGTKVEIREAQGRGKVVINFYSIDDYERLRQQLLAGCPAR
ncbi:MAG: ParB/RepB/Spo0J family partition protein [Planctomycetota bacterium]